jgi:hypothetical protein
MTAVDKAFMDAIKEARLRRVERLRHVKTREACTEAVEQYNLATAEAFNRNW